MKPELRCHAALCRKVEQPAELVTALQEKISAALLDYKREKVSRQNSRLTASLLGTAAAVPRRRQLLTTGGQNFRPPVARSRSAPRLHSIDEEEAEEMPLEATDSLGIYFHMVYAMFCVYVYY